jgi:hypothetical protein
MTRSARVQREGQHALATEALAKSQITSIRRAATAYTVPWSTLQTRRQGVRTKHATPAATRKLTDTEEEVLIKYIFKLNNKGFPPQHLIMRKYINIILNIRDASPWPSPIGKN